MVANRTAVVLDPGSAAHHAAHQWNIHRLWRGGVLPHALASEASSQRVHLKSARAGPSLRSAARQARDDSGAG